MMMMMMMVVVVMVMVMAMVMMRSGICGVDPGSVQPLLTSWVHETQSPPKQLLD